MKRLSVVIGIALAVMAAWTMSVHVYRLLWEAGPTGAIDLKLFHEQVIGWFAGRPIYTELKFAMFPPASYVILWPLLGWLPVSEARWLWAVLDVGALVWLIRLLIKECGAQSAWERTFLALAVLSMNATGVSVGSGQLSVLLMPVMVSALLIASRPDDGWKRNGWVAVMFLVTLVKPTIAAPFFWVLAFAGKRWRPAVLVGAGYVALTVLAVSFQQDNWRTLLQGWLKRGSMGAATTGYGNLQLALAGLGLRSWMMPASLVVLTGLGVWIYRHRRRDVWLLIGVTAVVARLWTYHRVYDDLLLVLPAVALFRLARSGTGGIAGWLTGLLVLSLCAPGRLHQLPSPWGELYDAGHVAIWGVVLLWLLRYTQRTA